MTQKELSNTVLKGFENYADISIIIPYCCSLAQSCPTLCGPMDYNMQNFPVFHHLTELAETHVHRVGDSIQPPYPLLSPSPPVSIFPSIRVFPNELVLYIRWPKYWSFSFSTSESEVK